MGIVHIRGTVRGPTGHEEELEFLVDSGATYSVLPLVVWQRLGLKPRRIIRLSLADGTVIERQVSECYIVLTQGEGHSPVILGEPGDAPLLGVVTLENLGLIFNPLTRQLQPMRMLLV